MSVKELNWRKSLWRDMVAKSFSPREWYINDHDDNPNDGDSIMWVYRLNRMTLKYEVGYFTPTREWQVDSDFGSRSEAAYRVHWLNRGVEP